MSRTLYFMSLALVAATVPAFVLGLSVTPGKTKEAHVSIQRASDSMRAIAGATILETVTLVNDSSVYLPGVHYSDSLLDSGGATILTERFDIGPLAPQDEATLSYNLRFSPDSPTGSYTLVSTVSGTGLETEASRNGTLLLEPPVSALRVRTGLVGTDTSALATHVPRVSAGSLRETLTSASTSPMRDPVRRQTLIAGVSAKAPPNFDPGALFAGFYTMLLLGYLGLVRIAIGAPAPRSQALKPIDHEVGDAVTSQVRSVQLVQ